MINIANYTNFNINKCMDELQNLSYDWHHTTTVDGVTQLWVSDKIYIAINDNNINCFHNNNRASFYISSSTYYTSCTIIQTDNSIVFYVGDYDIIVVSKTKDINGNESAGVISRTSSGNWYMLTDNMTNYRPIPISCITDSTNLTQLIPICNPDGNEYFKDAFWVFMKKEYDQGKAILNNEYFYIYKDIAVKYTSSE